MGTKFSVKLEDKGQDLLEFITDDIGKVLEAKPFHSKLYQGAYIPIKWQGIGDTCMIHHPPHFLFGSLKYKVESITEL